MRGACAIISGASSGIGFELASILCGEYGCHVIGLARNKNKLDAAARLIGKSFIPLVCDITKESDRRALLDFIADTGFKPDILINNAGMLPKFACFTPAKAEELEQVMQLNFHAHVKMCAALLPRLLQSERGAIVNISSSAALAPLPGTAAYSASKAALLAFTQSLALEYSGRLFVCCVCPGMTATELFSEHEGNSLIAAAASPADRTARKIVCRLCRGQKKIVTGIDAHIMSIGNRCLGMPALSLFSFFIRRSGLPIFKDTFFRS